MIHAEYERSSNKYGNAMPATRVLHRTLVRMLTEIESHYDPHRPASALERRAAIERGEAQRSWPSGVVRGAGDSVIGDIFDIDPRCAQGAHVACPRGRMHA
jgi:hypothetical protein